MNWAMPRCTPPGQRRAPAALLGRGIEHAAVLRMVAEERATELERILAGGARRLVDEALEVDAVLVRVDAAPRPDRHMGVAHRVFDEEVRHGVAELRLAGLLPVALELAHVLAVLDRRRVERGIDRLARDADVQADEIARRVEPGGEAALRDRPEEVLREILLAAPDQLHRRVRETLGDRDRLVDVVLRAAAPAKAAAEIVLVDLAFAERQARRRRKRGERCLGVLRRDP